MKKYFQNNKTEIFCVAIIIIAYIAIRSIHFSTILNFSSEQASFAMKAFQLWNSKKIELIGPPISWRYEGRYFFQGSITYYMMIPFLLLGGWDPIKSSYVMVLFGALMAVVLYKAVSLLASRKTAILVTLFFIFLPFYIDYSRFFWNPNLQFLLNPLLLLWMGLYQKTRKNIYLFLVSFSSGVLMLFHYQFFLIILGLIIYYLFIKKIRGLSVLIFFLGFPLGFSPLIIFELRNKFYNLQTLYLFLQHREKVFPKGGHIFDIFTSYYMLSPSLYAMVVFFSLLERRITNKLLVITGSVLIIWALIKYLPSPSHAFGTANDWNVGMELKVNALINKNKRESYNIVNLSYDTVAAVQKYLLTISHKELKPDEYYHNEYLFVVAGSTQDMDRSKSYEMAFFTPRKIMQEWKLNGTHTLYLLQSQKLR